MTSGRPREGSGRRVTLAQVAAHAGVSPSAVSFVMNGRTDQRLSAETFERVRRAADELGYRPNMTAKTLRTGRSGTVALVSDFVASTSFANSMVRGALEELRRQDTLLFTVDTQGEPELEEQLLHSLIGRHIDGVIYASMFTREVALSPLLRSVPLVLLNCVSKEADTVPAVVPDERRAGFDAAELLRAAGHDRHIWFVGTLAPGRTGGHAWHDWNPLALTQRLGGIAERLSQDGLALAGEVPIAEDWDAVDGRAAVADLLSSGARPTALICVNDAVAVGAYQALRAAGLEVPRDVSIVGFDGSQLALMVEPELTTLALPQEELGRRAARLLHAPSGDPSPVLVRMPLRNGASVAVPGR